MVKLTKFETARIIGARALQISMGAPILIKRPKDYIIEHVNNREQKTNRQIPRPPKEDT